MASSVSSIVTASWAGVPGVAGGLGVPGLPGVAGVAGVIRARCTIAGEGTRRTRQWKDLRLHVSLAVAQLELLSSPHIGHVIN